MHEEEGYLITQRMEQTIPIFFVSVAVVVVCGIWGLLESSYR